MNCNPEILLDLLASLKQCQSGPLLKGLVALQVSQDGVLDLEGVRWSSVSQSFVDVRQAALLECLDGVEAGRQGDAVAPRNFWQARVNGRAVG